MFRRLVYHLFEQAAKMRQALEPDPVADFRNGGIPLQQKQNLRFVDSALEQVVEHGYSGDLPKGPRQIMLVQMKRSRQPVHAELLHIMVFHVGNQFLHDFFFL